MEKAIVTGSTGLVGRATVRCLSQAGVDVLAIGRKKFCSETASDFFDCKVSYIELDLSGIDELEEKINGLRWEVGDRCVFYHFAWKGVNRLTDGNLRDQLRNVVYAQAAVKVAKHLGCVKFITSGSMEESHLEAHLGHRSAPYSFAQNSYALAKIASRNVCNLTSFFEKIDYVHTRISVPLAQDLSGDGYIANTLRKICLGHNYQTPKNLQLFDLISTDEVARAYLAIGKHGKNKANYFIGTGSPQMLRDYFELAQDLNRGSGHTLANDKQKHSESNVNFDVSELTYDTGFEPSEFNFNFTLKKEI